MQALSLLPAATPTTDLRKIADPAAVERQHRPTLERERRFHRNIFPSTDITTKKTPPQVR